MVSMNRRNDYSKKNLVQCPYWCVFDLRYTVTMNLSFNKLFTKSKSFGLITAGDTSNCLNEFDSLTNPDVSDRHLFIC